MTDALPDILVDLPPSKFDSRWSVLAALRFLLAMVVVAWHLIWFAPANQPPLFLESLGGTAAVVGFLFISGYSIAHSLEQRPTGFFKRRVLRIYPLYLVSIFFALVPFLSGADALQAPGNTFARPHAWVVVGNLLMLQNMVCLPIDSNTLVWTLGVEVICYCFAPLFRKTRSVYLLILICLSATAFGYYPRMKVGHYATLLYGLPLLMFCWAWIAGFLLQRYRNAIWVGVSIAVLGAVLMTINTTYHTAYSAYTVAGAALVVTFAPQVGVWQKIRPLLNYLGDLSYPIYLFHLPVFVLGYCIMNVTSQYGLIAMALATCAAFLLVEEFAKKIFLSISSHRVRPSASANQG